MKKRLVIGLCMVFLSGCAAEETFETVADEQVQSVSAPLRQLQVELPELETRTYSINKFRADNVPQGMTAQIYTQLLEVKLRGRGPILDRIKPEHITAVVDLTGEAAGMFSLPVEFEIEGFGTVDNVGAVEKYSVKGKLSEPLPESAAVTEP